MILLIIFALFAGIVTILSPCILPILPIVLSGSLTGGKKRPIGIIIGFILSFTFFTLFLTLLVKATGLSADLLRNISVIIVALFGVSLLVPRIQVLMEQVFSRLASIVPSQKKDLDKSKARSDVIAGFLIGLSLGLVWTPCVGPILASIITLAATSKVGTNAIFITLAYSIGTSVPLLAITYGGRRLLQRIPWLVINSAKIQKAFGIMMILTAVAIYLAVDRKFQAYILDKFPNYGVGLTKFEDNTEVKKELEKLQQKSAERKEIKSMFNFLESDLGNAPDFIAGGKWFNLPSGTKELRIKDLRGKVVLVDFWTYTCINCIRTLPYLKTWYQRYSDKGLIIVGVHTPEFEFEKNPDNVARAIKDFGIEYPVMQDNDYATWNAYANHYWPAKYLIDKDGKIRNTHFGEGGYDETEEFIQKLLKETGSQVTEVVSNPEYKINARTPESYLGYRRIEFLASPEKIGQDKPTTYSIPNNLPKNSFGLGGVWTIGDERSIPGKGSTLLFHFDAGEVFLVMRPKNGSNAGHILIYLDGKRVTNDVSGEDVVDGEAIPTTDRLYKLIKLEKPGSHLLKLEFLDNNLELYAFTFG